MNKKPLMNYKTEENRKNLVFEDNEIKFFNHCTDNRYSDGRPIGWESKSYGNVHRVEVNGNKGLILERLGDYYYIVNDSIVTQCVGCSFEYIELLTRDNVEHGDYQKQYEIREEIIARQVEQGVNA